MASYRQTYTAEKKAAVIASLFSGNAIDHVAKQFNVPPGTVKVWRAQYVERNNLIEEKREEIAKFLLLYLSESLSTLKKQVRFFSNRQWLEKQNAHDIAILHGVIADKTTRLLEALAGEPTNEESTSGMVEMAPDSIS